MEIPKVLKSTENPGKVSITFQGGMVLAILYIAHQFGFDVSSNDALTFVEGTIIVVSTIVSMYGIIRKVTNGKLHG